MKRHPRAFWAGLVAEIDRGAAVGEVARVHGVAVSTLRWWRWTLRRETRSSSPRLVPVVLRAGAGAAIAAGHVDISVRGLVVRVGIGTDVDYAAALVRALESC